MVNNGSFFSDMYQCYIVVIFGIINIVIDKKSNSCTKKQRQSLISAKPIPVDAMYKIKVNVTT